MVIFLLLNRWQFNLISRIFLIIIFWSYLSTKALSSTSYQISQSTIYKSTQNNCDDVEPEIIDSYNHSLNRENIADRSESTAANSNSEINISVADNAAIAVYSDTSGSEYIANSTDNHTSNIDRSNPLSVKCINSHNSY